jgi:flagellar biosynthesis/type III secretory pathway chaperone
VTIKPLLETLNKLTEIHHELLVLAKEKTPVLVHNKIDKLNAIMHKENKLIKHVEELDQLRVQTTGEYLISRGYNPDPRISVNDLIKIIFKAEDKKALGEVQKGLFSIIMELRKVNEVNQKLTEQSLAFINYSMDLFVRTPEQDAFYQNPHQPTNSAVRNGLFDTRA